MNSLIHADIFFLITSVAVVILGIIIAIGLVYLVRILRNVRDISEDVKHISGNAKVESDHLAEDVADLRANVRHRGFRIASFTNLFSRLFKKRKRSKR